MKKFSFIFFCLLLMGLLGGCGIEVEDTQEHSGQFFYYYLNKDASKLEKEDYVPKEEDMGFMVKDLMQRLGSKSPDGKEIDLLPQEVTINSYELQDDVLVIDFNSQYSKMSRVREVLVRAGVVKTFLQIPGIGAVRFTVIGEDLKDTKNQPIGNMTADSFMEYSGTTDLEEYRFDTLVLYFTDKSGKYLVPEERNVYYKRSLPKERVVFEQLAKGPIKKGNYPTIPGSTSVDRVFVSDGICYLYVDNSFLDYALEIPEDISIYSVVNSIIASCGEEKVEISVKGNTEAIFGENAPLYHFYEKNEDLIQGMDTYY